jgi:hypothetical protein
MISDAVVLPSGGIRSKEASRMARLKVLPFLLAVGVLLPLTAGAAIDQMWARHHAAVTNYEELDHTVAVVTDRSGYVYTAGTSHDTLSDSTCYVTTKYNEWGRQVWCDYFKYFQYDYEHAYVDSMSSSPLLAIDNANGYLYLAATERWWPPEGVWSHRVRIVKYAMSTGAIVWSETLFVGNPNGWIDDYVTGMAFDSVNNNLYICATTWHDRNPGAPGDTYNYDWGIVRVNPNDGNAVWKTFYGQAKGPNQYYTDFATGIAIGPGRDPVVCGACYNSVSLYYNWTVARFNRATGALTWANPWHRLDSCEDNEEPWAICANDSGIYVAGFVYNNASVVYGYALAKFRPDSTSSGSAYGFAFDEGYLKAVKHTPVSGGSAYATGTVWNNLSSSYDWFTLACSTGLRPTDSLSEKWQALLDTSENDDIATAVQLDSVGRPWVMGSVDHDTLIDWMLRRYNPANGTLLAPDLAYHRNTDWDNFSVPTSFSIRDTNHVYVGGFTLNDSSDDNHTIVRFGVKFASAALDSLRDSTFAWRDSVDSGATVQPRAFWHNSGYSLATPKLKTSISPFYADSTTDTIGAPPDSARQVLMPGVWTALQRGVQTLKCTLDLAGDTSPANNLRTKNVFVRVRDVGPDQVILADTFEEGGTITPEARVHNYGNTTALSFSVTFQIGDSFKTATVTNLKPDSVLVVTFGSLTLNRGKYRVRAYTGFATDMNRFNDTLDRADSLFIRYQDVSCRGIIVPVGNYNEDTVITPSAAFKNFGNATSGFWTHFLINPAWDKGTVSPIPTIALPGLDPQSPRFGARQPGTPVLPVKRQLVTNKRLAASLSPGAPGLRLAIHRPQSAFGEPQDLPYHESLFVTLAPGESAARTYPNWTASPAGTHQADCYTLLANDRDRRNDTAHSPFSVGRHDVAVVAITAPRDTIPEGNVTPQATVHNYGTSSETFEVFFGIAGGTPWTDSLVLALASGRDSTVNFRNWAATVGNYTGRCSTYLATDADHSNDTLSNTFVVAGHDVGVVTILAPRDTVLQGNVTPRATVHNYGSVTETFKVYFRITGGAAWVDSVTAVVGAGHDSTLDFRTWAATPGNYTGKCSTGLATDADRSNDTLSAAFVVVRHDVGTVAILAPRDTMLQGNVTPRASVHNYGSVPETFKVYFRISGGAPWIDSVTAVVGVDRDSTLDFRTWAATPGNYTGKCSTGLATDADRSNDTLSAAFVVVRHDVGVISILAPSGTVQQGNVTPQAAVHNYGSVTETFRVFLKIAGPFPYDDSFTLSLLSGRDSIVSFPVWNAMPGNYSTRCSMYLATDADHSNDTLSNTFVVVRHDVGVVAIIAPRDTVPEGNVTPQATVHNYGSITETFKVYFRIAGGTPWIDSVTAVVGAGRDSTVNFRTWAATSGSYTGKCSTGLATDADRSNDTLSAAFVVVQHDVGAVAILAPRDTLAAGPVTPLVTVHNYGSQAEAFGVFFWIAGVSNYSDSLTLTLAGGRDSTLSFPAWNAVPGSYTGRCSTWLATDANRSNDVAGDTFVVVRHDVAALAIVAPSGMVPPGVIQPRATVHNYGTVPELFKVFFRIAGTTSYADSVTITLGSGLDSLVRFANWNALAGSYAGRCSTALATDADRSNDTVSNAFTVAQSDVGVLAILAPRDTVPLELLQPQVRVHNYGAQVETFQAFFRINGPTSYADSLTVSLGGGLDSILSFATWLPATGIYTARCSTWLAPDANPANDTLGLSFRAMVIIPPGWTRRLALLPGARRKNVKDGGALAWGREPLNDTDFVYAFKGNNTYEFYRYNVATNTWVARESIPARNRLLKKKAVKKGSSLAFGTDGRIYATKGNGTYDFWQYDPNKPWGTRWSQMEDVPLGAKKCKEGVGAAAVRVGGGDYVYLLKGSNTTEFYRYSIGANAWEAMPNAPLGTSGKMFKNGSCLTYDGGDTIFALKGTYNEFFTYSISGRNWTTRETLPRIAPPGTRKTKVKDGAGIAYNGRVVYTMKGGNTNEFWTYRCPDRRWLLADPMPAGLKKVKGGGSLTFGADRCWAFRGNNTLEFWQYKPTLADGLPRSGGGSPKDVMGDVQAGELRFGLSIAPNPLGSAAEIAFSLPGSGDVNLGLYDVTGRLDSGLYSGRRAAGHYRFTLAGSQLPAGIYFLKLRFNDGGREQQLVTKVLVER